MAYKPKAPELIPDINVVPMADIMLVLLIIFMVVTPMMQKGYSVDLASTENPREMPDADREDAVLLAVTRSGNIFLGNQQILPEQITQKVRDIILNRLDKTVYVKSDARAKYGNVVRVVDEVRAAGVDQLGLLTERVQKQGAPRVVPIPQVTPGSP
ncbi:MAG: biopolymer transporter ExbD [Acidobacteria bacterium]|nr:biopolymer transporter ExbD [Acidobacteriota bacterium]